MMALTTMTMMMAPAMRQMIRVKCLFELEGEAVITSLGVEVVVSFSVEVVDFVDDVVVFFVVDVVVFFVVVELAVA